MKRLSLVLSFILLFASLESCKNDESTGQKKMGGISGIDSSRNPGDNFFLYANGKWYDTATIPVTQTGVGSYMFLNYPQRIRLQGILDSISKDNHAPGSIEQKIGDFYASGMDTVTIEKRGYEPIQPILARVDSITDVPSLMRYVADEQKANDASIIGFYVGPDDKNSSINIVQFYQTGIGLPDRDYYFKTDASTIAIQNAYKKYLVSIFELTGSDSATAKKNMEIVYNIEKQLAAVHKTNIERRDIQANYHKMAVADLSKKQINIGWETLLNNLGVRVDSVNMQQPAYYEKLNALLKSLPISDWKTYLRASTIGTYASSLSTSFADASFEYSKVLTGQAVKKPRAEEMVSAVDSYLGMALAQLYVKKYFTEDAKKRMLELVENLQKAFEARINGLDWMSDSTKVKAKEKLHTFVKKIGYPDKWKDYSNVVINRNTYFENIVSASKNEYLYQTAKVGKPVDRTEWQTTPPTVTAYNNPSHNEIVFPAGILQFPYFDNSLDDAINYGGIGMVIGHEMTHSFDDQGAQYDKDGNVKNWWTKDDYEKFKSKTQQVIDLYSSFTVLDTVHVKGALTVGENTADNGGIAIAYDAFKMTPQGQDTTKIDGFTPDQRFFLSVARIWRVKTRDEFLRMYVNTNGHSPAMWRVNGPLMNFPPFYKAFNIQPGQMMYRPDSVRIKIW
ncbi:MAG: M13 family metallopeptidase [Bacteroidota bacterium]